VAPNNGVDQEKNVFAYQEIANLHEINVHYPIHKLALEDWQRRVDDLTNSESRREGRSAEVTNQIYNIFGWFAVFQGVVLTAVSQLTQTASEEPVCRKIWFPIVLTGFATVATTLGILQKFTILQSLEKTIHTDRQAKTELAKRALHLRSEGPNKFKFHKDADNSKRTTTVKPFWTNRIYVIVCLFIFTFIFIMSYFSILCDTWLV
jgi:quinol-cytochrome oxidoreductase complex cytochrome b subunit